MPELPEVETIVRGLGPCIIGGLITKAITRCPRLRWPIPQDLDLLLAGQNVLSLARRGKYILLHLSNGTLIVHLGMSGRLCFLNTAEAAKKHDHVDIIFANNSMLRYTDPRRFGAILWTSENIETYPLLSSLGVEPLSDDFTAEYLLRSIANRRMAIKPLIMVGKIVVGVGNIYAAEALFMSGIHPALPANLLNNKQGERLVAMIRQVLEYSITQGGTTLKDFVNSDGLPGYFAHKLNVYGRGGLPCVVCKNKLSTCVLGQRGTVYCDYCQH